VILPHAQGYEMWPYPIARIEISRFKFVGMNGPEIYACD
jgi:hypothetical protein